MAVYTKLSEEQLKDFFNKYNLGKLINYRGIKEGIENTNYFIQTEKGSFILTLYEKRVDEKDLPFFIGLMKNLFNKNFPSPEPIINKNGNYISEISGKKSAVVSFLNGKDKIKLNLNNCFEVGKVIANIHKITKKINISRKNSMGIKELGPLLKSIHFKSKKFNNLQNFLANNLKDIKKNWPSKLPQGVIHGDLFIDNIFFNKDKLSGVIDFYFAANDIFMYEIAICINALCFDYKNKKFLMNKQKINKLIKGYESVKKISLNEKKSLNILCRGAAMRYLLTRLYDYSNTPSTALIKIKDPNEYYQKLITHNNLKSYKDYLN